MNNYFDIELPVGCSIYITGDKVSNEQAEDILVKTLFCVNTVDNNEYLSNSTELLVLPYLSIIIDYVHNHLSRCWISNDGDILYMGILNDATVEELYNEWFLIAEAFPYLNLKCQLANFNSFEKKHFITFVIKDGEVTMVTDYTNFQNGLQNELF